MSIQESDVIRKVQALLAKAESTQFEAEAEALYAKAQELMLRHAIDEATIAQAAVKGQIAKPIKLTMTYSTNDANLPGKKQLLMAIARHNRCKAVFYTGSKREQTAVIVGFEDDVRFVELLYASLLLQAQRDGSRAYRVSNTTKGRKVFLTQFMLGFAQTINRRMDEVATKITGEAGHSAALALRDREDIVADALADFFPNLRSAKRSRLASDWTARAAGSKAAENADISGGRNNLRTTKAIGK